MDPRLTSASGDFDTSIRAWARRLAPLRERSITAVVDISNKCNIRCRMCHFAFDNVFFRKARFMNPELFRTVAEKVFPYCHTVWLSASNEPLTSPHFAEILKIASTYSIPDLKFLTNGLLLTPELVDAIIVGGVTQVHVSIDGATRETYEDIRSGGRFERLLENLRLLQARKLQLESRTPLVQFNLTLMRRNVDELEAFVDLGERLGVERIAARHLMAFEGLGMEEQVLSRDKRRANSRFRAFLARIARSRMTLASFPDLFAEADAPPEQRGPVDPVGVVADDPGEQLRGAMDHPVEETLSCATAIELSGWALDRAGPVAVRIYRDPAHDERAEVLDQRGLVPLGSARFLTGCRPDVAALHPDFPLRHRNAWRFELGPQTLKLRDPSARYTGRLVVEAVAQDGRRLTLAHRRLVTRLARQRPLAFCEKPFENVHVDAEGKVYPYPDCQSVDAFGAIEAGQDFQDVWFGERFTELRERILEGDPPSMCHNCGHFINRNVDDPAYFRQRAVEVRGYLEQVIEVRSGLVVQGWLLVGVEPASRIHLVATSGRLSPGTRIERPDVATLVPGARGTLEAGFAAVAPREWAASEEGHDLSLTAELGESRFTCRLRAPRGVRWKGSMALRNGAELVLRRSQIGARVTYAPALPR